MAELCHEAARLAFGIRGHSPISVFISQWDVRGREAQRASESQAWEKWWGLCTWLCWFIVDNPRRRWKDSSGQWNSSESNGKDLARPFSLQSASVCFFSLVNVVATGLATYAFLVLLMLLRTFWSTCCVCRRHIQSNDISFVHKQSSRICRTMDHRKFH